MMHIVLQVSRTRYLVGKRGISGDKFHLIAECKNEVSADTVVRALNLTIQEPAEAEARRRQAAVRAA